MSLRFAVAGALASSIWTALLSLAAVPVYVSHLGMEAYGIIGFFVTTQAALQVLDLGLAPALNREVARSVSRGEIEAARTLLRTLSRIYWLVAVAIAVVIGFAASWIGTSWLGASRLRPQDVAQALVLMGVLIAARWPIAVYQNALIGLERLGAVSALNAAMSTLTVSASIAAVMGVSPKLQVLFSVQAAGSLLHALAMRALAWHALGGTAGAKVDIRSVQRIWRFSLGMAGVTLTGIALTQLDKALLSRLLPLEAFGHYMLAATVVGGLSVVVSPLFNSIYPRFSALIACRQDEAVRALYQKGTQFFAVIFLPLVIALAVYGYDIVWLWTGSADTAEKVHLVITLLCIGSAINGLMYFPYSLQLACGMSWIPFVINSALLILAAPLIVVLTRTFGGPGGAAAWALLEGLYILVGTRMTHRYVPALGSEFVWLWNGVLIPLLICGAIGLAFHPLITQAQPGSATRVALIVVTTLASQLACVVGFPSMRARLIAEWRSRGATAAPA